MDVPGTPYVIEIHPTIPKRLERLEELADNLWYSWDHATGELFRQLDPALWNITGHSPKAFLRRVHERHLLEAAANPVFLANFNRVLSAYDTYHGEPLRHDRAEWLRKEDLVAYFCAEFGFHESLPIYSGGLGILAGDYCKAASDLRLPLVGVGLLYREGYFLQSIDGDGVQHATYVESDFRDLPVTMVLEKENGAELRVSIDFPGRTVSARVWRTRVGHVSLYLLDTDVAENSTRDRGITHRLYGGDRIARIEQEIVLGIGGVRALAALGLRPTVWHMNEGHAAFLMLERIRSLAKQGIDFPTALEAVAVNTVFTTHTAVPAGHDHFDDHMVSEYFASYAGEVGVSHDVLLALGRARGRNDFDMTSLAIRGSRFHNGVSRLHGRVSSDMLQELWPEVPAEENPIDYVTNGVHVPTFLALEWVDLFDRFLGPGWAERMHNRTTREGIEELPDHIFWSVHQYLKSRMLHAVRQRMRQQHLRNQSSEAHLDRLLRWTDPDNPVVLTIGFARRFATYKRATLLFENLDWLRQIMSDAKRPVIFIFAGRAHPADVPGQTLIRDLAETAKLPEFEGKLLLLEGYDLRLARRLVSGVDVWLNNPVHPLEASGTSGMKAGMNGVINLSVLDGWWDEGYEGDNGWAIKPAAESLEQARRDLEESRTLYEILQDRVIPLYYERGTVGYSPEWIRMAKRSIASILPRYNAARMVGQYVSKFYLGAAQRGRRYSELHLEGAKAIAAWKAHVRAAWPGVAVHRTDPPAQELPFGKSMTVELAVKLNGLKPEDVIVELLLAAPEHDAAAHKPQHHPFVADGTVNEAGEHRYVLEVTPDFCGRLDYRVRLYPWHRLLAHPFELGLMLWS